ncbi:citrate lyase subunit beta/citryl-CoA lyase [Sphingobium xanthum]|nr:citrate lyase subunit beta/citryl-CoA lyase [Sphingobium sp. B10D3B]MCW2401738.1 citrate lyase subunit beta/citryl-CoA lyase [Sphingobium sp. B10D7B]MCW2408717.1 citrate lyase subunit beta/citryl-CoA lyase [Sphingobium xanthum]
MQKRRPVERIDLPLRLVRTLLFVPASRPRAIEKARQLDCDFIILDLEDSVIAEDRDAARQRAVEAVQAGFDGRPCAIRINAEGRPEHGLDMVAARSAGVPYVIVPKVIEARQVHDVNRVTQRPVIAMIESPAGIINALSIAREPGVSALVAGTNDLRRGLAVPPDAPRSAISYSLQSIVLAARAAGVAAFDGVYNNLEDPAGLAAECDEGRQMGFDGKTIIHPSHIDIANDAFSPSGPAVEQARALVEAFTGGAQRYDGRMIEAMHVEEAKAIIDRAERLRS